MNSNRTQNARNGFVNYLHWLKWEPGDTEGAISFAGLQLDTVQDVDDMESIIEESQDAELESLLNKL